MALWGIAIMVAPIIGPTIGGYITEHYVWRWVFYVNVPLGAVALAILLAFFVEQAGGKTIIGMDPAFGLDAAQREGTRFVGPITALWYILFMVPYFLWVRDPAGRKRGSGGGFAEALELLGNSILLSSSASA